MLRGMLFLVPWLAAACALALPSSVSAPRPGASEALEEDFWRSCAGIEPALGEIKSIVGAFPAASDKDALIVRMVKLTDEFGKWARMEEDLRSEHHKLIQGLALVVLTGDIALVKAKRYAPTAAGSRLFGREQAAQKMKSQTERFFSAYREAEDTFRPMKDAYLVRKAAKRRAALCAGGVACALVMLFLYYAAGRPPPAAVLAPAPDAPSLPQSVAGNFEIIGLVGRGSMGEVYEAVDKTLGRRSALKRLRGELLQDPQELERLLNEARVMAALKHPNMVAIYSVEKDAGQVYLAMEFVAGRTLGQRLEAERRLPWAEALRILEGAGAAIDYAHEQKVIHRDLKPANIMLTEAGQVKVMDFGIAYQAAKSVSRLTRAPSWGTPPYMAPEQEMGGVSRAVDIFALSVCLYEMLTGELPFMGPNFLAQKREALWAAPSGLVPGLPQGIDGVFAAALAPEPSRRFVSAAALVAACRSLSP